MYQFGETYEIYEIYEIYGIYDIYDIYDIYEFYEIYEAGPKCAQYASITRGRWSTQGRSL